MRITCVGAWGRNFGDRAIQEGMATLLEGHEVEWFDIQGDARHDLHHWNECDALVVGGGGLLWNKPELDSPSEWQFRLTLDEIGALTVPVILYGLGWTQFPYHDPTGSNRMRASVTALHKKAVASSARNAYTAAKLGEWGLDFDVVPDAAWMCSSAYRKGAMTWSDPNRHNVALCWASDKEAWRWGREVRGTEMLAGLADRLRCANVMVVPHIQEMDKWVVELLRERGVDAQNAEERFSYLYPPKRSRVGGIIDIYAEADMVISMRKHGVILGALSGAATVPFGEMAEPIEIAREAGLAMDNPKTISLAHLQGMREAAMNWMKLTLARL